MLTPLRESDYNQRKTNVLTKQLTKEEKANIKIALKDN